MVVDMRLSIMILFLIAAIVVMAMHQFAVIVIVCMPICPVIPLTDYFAPVVVGNVVVIVVCLTEGWECCGSLPSPCVY